MGGFIGGGKPAFTPDQAPIPIGSTAGDVLTVTAPGVLGFAAPSGGFPKNGNVYWGSFEQANPAPFIVLANDGILSGSLFTYHSAGQYILDMTTLLSSGIYGIWGMVNTPFNDQCNAMLFGNTTFSGNIAFGPGLFKLGLLITRWTGSGFNTTDRSFSLLVIGE